MDQNTASDIVDAIVDDICDLAGLGNEWESIDEKIQDEIKERWIEIIMLYN